MSEQIHEAPEGAFGGAVVIHADTALEHAWLQAMVRVFRVFQAKQADYGPGNISAAGEHGVALRANDKVQRLLTLTRADAGASRVAEALADTWVDLADYGVIGLLVHEGAWPKPQPKTYPAWHSEDSPTEGDPRECSECANLKLAIRALMEKLDKAVPPSPYREADPPPSPYREFPS